MRFDEASHEQVRPSQAQARVLAFVGTHDTHSHTTHTHTTHTDSVDPAGAWGARDVTRRLAGSTPAGIPVSHPLAAPAPILIPGVVDDFARHRERRMTIAPPANRRSRLSRASDTDDNALALPLLSGQRS